jgi:hypothetical protein
MSGGRPRLLVPTAVAFVLGLGLMLPFEYWWTRVLGMTALATFVVCGLLMIASPGFLEEDEEDLGERLPPPDA